ncbi:MAG: DNA polymerase III subunit delta' [Rhizobiaceae bacterium]
MNAGERLAPEQHDTLPEIAEPAENPLLIGHRNEASGIASAYRTGRLHHAILLHGPRGIGKATFAFAVARHLLAHPDAASASESLVAPDPQSVLFRQVATGAHPGVLHLTRPLDRDGKKFKTAITVDEVRRVAKLLSMTSHDGSYRVVVVDPADDMNINAANALLKNLEEPPSRTLFILISHAPGGLLPTIRSRCQAIRLQPLAPDDVLAVLAALGEPVPEDEAARGEIVRHAEGSPRSALLMTRYGGLDLSQALDAVLSAPRFDVAAAYKLAEAVSGRDADIQFGFLNETILERIAARAGEAAMAGELRHAQALSGLWQETRETMRETGVYNLDRKQHVVGLIGRLREGLV